MTKYEKGRKYEWKWRKKLREMGADFVIRSSASLSPFDLVALFRKERKVIFLQCKSGKTYTSAFKARLQEELGTYSGMYEVECHVV